MKQGRKRGNEAREERLEGWEKRRFGGKKNGRKEEWEERRMGGEKNRMMGGKNDG